MPLKNRFSLFFFLFVCSFFWTIQSQGQDRKGLYVNDFKNIIGDPVQEDALLEFAQQEGFNYLLLYNLYFIHRLKFEINHVASAAPLAAFIKKAKSKYGIVEVGGVGETFNSFNVIGQYNVQHDDPLERFDVYNLEFEFWNTKLVDNYYCSAYLEKNDLGCSTDDAFEFYLKQLQQIQTLAHSHGIKSETYIGKPNKTQCQLIGQNCDRVLVHFYRKSDVYKNGNSIYNYKKDRIENLAPTEGALSVMPIFSSRSNHMGPWLEEQLMDQALETFMFGQNGYDDDNGDWKNHVRIEGVQWYRYTDLVYYSSQNTTKNPLTQASLNLQNLMASAPSPFEMGLEEEVVQGMPASSGILSSDKIFPNPSNEQVTVETENMENATYRLLDINGEELERGTLGPNPMTSFNITDLENGIYYLIFKKDDERSTEKIIVRR